MKPLLRDILVGFALSVAVAWALAIAHDRGHIPLAPSTAPSRLALEWPRAAALEGTAFRAEPFPTAPDRVEEKHGFGVQSATWWSESQALERIAKAGPGSSWITIPMMTELRFGIPLPCLRRDEHAQWLSFQGGAAVVGPPWTLQQGIPLGNPNSLASRPARLPIIPIAFNLIANAIVCAMAVFTLRTLIRYIRRPRGGCRKCHYPIIATSGAVCPECGSSRNCPGSA